MGPALLLDWLTAWLTDWLTDWLTEWKNEWLANQLTGAATTTVTLWKLGENPTQLGKWQARNENTQLAANNERKIKLNKVKCGSKNSQLSWPLIENTAGPRGWNGKKTQESVLRFPKGHSSLKGNGKQWSDDPRVDGEGKNRCHRCRLRLRARKITWEL